MSLIQVEIQAQFSPEQLLHAIEQMPSDELDLFVDRVIDLRSQRKTPCLSPRESELLLKINQGLPEDLMRRWNTLIDKREDSIISPEELEELKRLTEQVEWYDSERAVWLAELAQLRGMSLTGLIQQLSIKIKADA
ncbi:MAG: STAS/SEC14 domain-containing protein [Blastocatellia bacterium]